MVVSLTAALVVAVAAFYGWRFWTAHTNRGRAVEILCWIEKSLCGHGHVTGIRWLTKSEFEVPLRLASNVFVRSNVRVKIADEKLLWHGLKRETAIEPETMTFHADLDYKPAFNMELNNLRFFARSKKDNDLSSPSWQFEKFEPIVLTTRLDWEKELTAAMQSVLGVEQKEDFQIIFRKTSPNFSVTLPLEKITPGSELPVFELLNSIATYSSAQAS
jgi:hypothetical protein